MGSCWHSSLSNSISFNLYLRFLFLSQFERVFWSVVKLMSPSPSGHNHARLSSGNSISLLSLSITSKEQTQASIPSSTALNLITYHRWNKIRILPPASITYPAQPESLSSPASQICLSQVLMPPPRPPIWLPSPPLPHPPPQTNSITRSLHNIFCLKTIQLSCPASWQCCPSYLQANSKSHKVEVSHESWIWCINSESNMGIISSGF